MPNQNLDTRNRTVRALGLLLASGMLLATGCGGGDSSTSKPPVFTGWEQVTPGATLVDGASIVPTCSNVPGTDPTYRFFVRRGTSKELMVFFGGGGACWDGESCSRPNTRSNPDNPSGFYFGELLPNDNPANYAGVLSLSDPANPMRDWNMVYVPNCTGDLHTGSKTTTYVNPATQQPFPIEHRGAENAKVVLNWVQAHFSDPGQVLVTGSSAGAYGATVHYPRIRRAYPSARASLLVDASPSVMPPAFETIRKERWNLQLDGAVYGSDAQTSAMPDLMGKLTAHYPADRFSQYATASDMTLMRYHDAMANGANDTVQGTSCQIWTDGMRAALAANQGAANFRSYLAAGTSHTILGGTNRDASGTPLFNRERSAGGVSFANWVASHLSASGAGWSNAACTDCAVAPPCPY